MNEFDGEAAWYRTFLICSVASREWYMAGAWFACAAVVYYLNRRARRAGNPAGNS